jgi:hypothetical protein
MTGIHLHHARITCSTASCFYFISIALVGPITKINHFWLGPGSGSSSAVIIHFAVSGNSRRFLWCWLIAASCVLYMFCTLMQTHFFYLFKFRPYFLGPALTGLTPDLTHQIGAHLALGTRNNTTKNCIREYDDLLAN